MFIQSTDCGFRPRSAIVTISAFKGPGYGIQVRGSYHIPSLHRTYRGILYAAKWMGNSQSVHSSLLTATSPGQLNTAYCEELAKATCRLRIQKPLPAELLHLCRAAEPGVARFLNTLTPQWSVDVNHEKMQWLAMDRP